MADLVLPFVLLLAFGAVLRKTDVYGAFTRGAERGLRTLFRMASVLIPLLAILGMFLSSGFSELAEKACGPLLTSLGLSPGLLPVMLLRPLSGSASLSAASELLRKEGTASLSSRIALTVLSAGETTLYTAGIYLAGRKTRHAPAMLISALLGDLAASLFAVFLILQFFSNSP